MPGGKERMKKLFPGGFQAGNSGDYCDQLLSGSIAVTIPGFAGEQSPSLETAEVTIAGLGASDLLMVMPDIGMSACVALQAARAGAGKASLVFLYAGCAASMDTASVNMRYIAFSRG